MRSGEFGLMRDAIAAAYRDRAPDDGIEVLESAEAVDELLARYAWLGGDGRAAGDPRLSRVGDRIARLVVSLDAA
jgi:hypothetical protein